MLTVRLGSLIGRITFFAFRPRATFHTAWITDGLAADTPVVTDGSYWLKAALTQSTIPSEG
jgi:hypothetical protein